MKILLTGKNGQVGWELQRTLAPLGELVAVGHAEMDLASPDSIRNIIRAVKPNLIVNAAAYTAVDKAESEPEVAMQINGIAPGIIAEEAKRLGAAMVHYSTDYVFDGTKKSPYTEEDEPNPINIYGKTKLAGDLAIEAVGIPHLIFRTSWVYGTRGHNFLLTMLRLASEKSEIRVVDDQIGSPTWSRDIAEASAAIIRQRFSNRGSVHPQSASQVFNLSAEGSTSWFAFASAALEGFAGAVGQRGTRLLVQVSSEEYSSPATRPAKSTLCHAKTLSAFRVRMQDWQHSLRKCMKELEPVEKRARPLSPDPLEY